jgi:hypothetical protein
MRNMHMHAGSQAVSWQASVLTRMGFYTTQLLLDTLLEESRTCPLTAGWAGSGTGLYADGGGRLLLANWDQGPYLCCL